MVLTSARQSEADFWPRSRKDLLAGRTCSMASGAAYQMGSCIYNVSWKNYGTIEMASRHWQSWARL